MSAENGKLIVPKTGLRLYEIADTYQRALSELPESGMDDVTISDTLEALHGELTVKAQAVSAYILNMEAETDAVDALADRLKARVKASRARTDSLRNYLFINMQRSGITEIKADDGTFTAKIKNNPPAVDVYAPEFVPDEYMKVPEPPPPAPIKSAIKDALKAGIDVPGCRLTQSQRLEIR